MSQTYQPCSTLNSTLSASELRIFYRMVWTVSSRFAVPCMSTDFFYKVYNSSQEDNSSLPRSILVLLCTYWIITQTSMRKTTVRLIFFKKAQKKKTQNKPRLLGRVKLTSAVPPSNFIYAGQQVLLRESTYREWRLEVDHISRNIPVTILDFTAELHGYHSSLEAICISFSYPCVYAITLSYILLFY